MNSFKIICFPLWIIFLLFNSLWIVSCDTPIDFGREEQAIRKVWQNNINSICTGNWDEFAAVWDHSAEVSVIHPHSGEWLKGWKEVSYKYEQVLNSGMRCILVRNDLTLHISSSGDIAWGTVDMIVQFNDSNKTTNHPWQTVVFEKIKGEWKLVYLLSTLPKLE